MSRRLDIQLTSARDDGTWTWRAAGARQPRGTLRTDVLPPGAKVGDVLRVEADVFVDGVTVIAVIPGRGPRPDADRLEIIDVTPEGPLVTSNVTGAGERRGPRERRPGRDERGDRRGRSGAERRGPGAREGGSDRRPGDRRPGEQRAGERRDGAGHDGRDRRPARSGDSPRGEGGRRRPGGDEHRRARPAPPPMPAVERPKTRRLRARRVHRDALLADLAAEQRPVAEQLFAGGIPAVRQAITKQNEERASAGESAIAPEPLVALAEQLWPRVRTAEWRDRAEAAMERLDDLDLRDLRSVVSQADAAARDEEGRALAAQLREALAARVAQDHAAWLAELDATLEVGRVVRALRVSSRPPKAGAPLPAEVAARLSDATGAALTADATSERWIAVLEALAVSPVRDRVIPQSLPATVDDDLRAAVARLGSSLPKVAHIFDIEPAAPARRPRPERRRPRPRPAPGGGRPARGDAGPPDAGSRESGSPDTGPPDAVPADAGDADAGSDDARAAATAPEAMAATPTAEPAAEPTGGPAAEPGREPGEAAPAAAEESAEDR